MSWPELSAPGPAGTPPAPPLRLRFPHCAACQRSPGKLCPGHGAAAEPASELTSPGPGEPAWEWRREYLNEMKD
jgi:hypothetical protein